MGPANIPETVLGSPLRTHGYPEFAAGFGCDWDRYYPPPPILDRRSFEFKAGRSFKEELKIHRTPTPRFRPHEPSLTPMLLRIGDSQMTPGVSQRWFVESAEDTRRHLSALSRGISESVINSGDHPLRTTANVPSPDSEVILWLQRGMFWQNLVERSVEAAKDGKLWIRWKRNWISRSFLVVDTDAGWVGLTYTALLMIKDLCHSHWITHLTSGVFPDKGFLSQALAEYRLISDSALETYGNEAYAILKGIEPLCQVRIVKLVERYLDADEQISNMLGRFREKEDCISRELGVTNIGVAQNMWNYLSCYSDPRELSEIFGFLKMSGHPYINAREGCRSARLLAQKPLDIKWKDCQLLEWSACHLFTRGYLVKKGEWPRLRFDDIGRKTKLQELYESNQPVLPLGQTLYPPSDWQWAHFDHNLSLNEGDDILSLLSDTAISNLRDEFDSCWNGLLEYTPPKASTSTRALREFLVRESFSTKAVMDLVSSREVPRNWKIVTVCPKEREMKKFARMFAMMVLEMRTFFVLLEKNIAEKVFPFIPEQTMTDSRATLISKFLEYTRPMKDRWITINIIMDFERWNLLWREQTVAPIGQRLNEMFGVNGLFTYGHEFFRESMIVLRDRDSPPLGLSSSNRMDPPQDESLWGGGHSDGTDHEGGFEGIFQKHWTFCTLAMILMALQPLGLSYSLIGQADNEVCVARVKVPSSVEDPDIPVFLRNITSQIKINLNREAAKVGQVIKPEECVESTSFLIYGKEMWADGAYLPTQSKYLARIFPSTSSDIPSFHDYISNISSGGTAATERGDNSLGCLVVTKFVESLFIRRELRRSILHGKEINNCLGILKVTEDKNDLMDLALSVPSNLGGLPISTSQEFLHRGHPDPLASSVASLYLLKTLPAVGRFLLVLQSGLLLDPKPQIQSLILSPHSIPLLSAVAQSGTVHGRLLQALSELAENKDVNAVFQTGDRSESDRLVRTIGMLRPAYPTIWNEIYKSSPTGVARAFSKRFTNTRTLAQLGPSIGFSPSRLSIRNSLLEVQSILARFSRVWRVKVEPMKDPMELIEDLRLSWGVGRLEGVTTLHPFLRGHFHLIGGRSAELVQEGCFGSGCVHSLMLTSNTKTAHKTRGRVQPYLGSNTQSRIAEKWVRPVDSSPPLKDVLQLLSIRQDFSTPQSRVWEFITEIIKSRIAVDLELVEQFGGLRAGGTQSHRALTRDDIKGSFWNMSPNWPSHITMSTNHAGIAGSTDHPISFQQHELACSVLHSWLMMYKVVKPPSGIVYCFELYPDDQLADQNMGLLTDARTGPWLTSANSYYSVVQNIKVSSRALSSSQIRGLSAPFEAVNPTIMQSLEMALVENLTGNLPLHRYRGYTWADTLTRPIIDYADARMLTVEELLGAASACVVDLSASRLLAYGTTYEEIRVALPKAMEAWSRRVAPRILGTLRVAVNLKSHGIEFEPGKPTSSPSQLAHVAWMLQQQALQRAWELDSPGVLYERGGHSPSSSLLMIACRQLLAITLSQAVPLRVTKRCRRIFMRCLTLGEETERVQRAVSLMRILNLTSWYRSATMTPQWHLRTLRTRNAEPLTWDGQCLEPAPDLDVIIKADMRMNGTTDLIEYRQPLRNDMIWLRESWTRRPFDTTTSARHRWSPLRSLIYPGDSVLVIGVGVGGLLRCIPSGCDVTVVESPAFLEHLGQDCVSYQPPMAPGEVQLSHLSWSMSASLYSEEYLQTMTSYIRSGGFNQIVIDLELGGAGDRLKLRYELAKSAPGVRCHTRVLVHPEDRHTLARSAAAFCGPGDALWETHIGVGREFIVSGGSSPLGLYRAPEQDQMRPIPLLRVIDTPQGQIAKAIVTHISVLTGSVPSVGYEDSLTDVLRNTRVSMLADHLTLGEVADRGGWISLGERIDGLPRYYQRSLISALCILV